MHGNGGEGEPNESDGGKDAEYQVSKMTEQQYSSLSDGDGGGKNMDEIKRRILQALEPGGRKGLVELGFSTKEDNEDFLSALQDLISQGLVIRNSDGFQQVFSASSVNRGQTTPHKT